ncbi:hypothetical protein CAEBREN_07595 [Caenorhabditis brenneri]|uniref:Serpentine Receptor, class H n=1 Tax=Caenorhabditis brenneri TaxID=135651 RepID=G0N8A7_CAEBE|nr:hypothetical protein CAEBREN_07595 [Caenorhabditis brenneri]
MSSVKHSMLVLHFLSAFLDIYMSFICIPVFTLPVSAGYPLGISLWLGIPTSVQVYVGCSLLSAVCVSILGSFEDRHHILRNGMNPRIRWTRVFYLSSLYILSFIYMLPTYMVMPNQIDGKYGVMQKVPCMPRDVLDRPGFFVLAVDSTVCVYSFTIESSFLAIQLMYFVISIVCRLSQNTLKSKETYKLQKQFLISLGLHTLIPTMMIIFPVIYLAVAISHNIYSQGATNFALTLISMHGMLSTVTMLTVHKPYRIATLTIFKFTQPMPSKVNESRIGKTVPD